MSTPDLFTVAEAAVVLRIGRTTAYELVRRDFESGGGEGLGVVRIGGQFRIPRSALEQIVGGPVTCMAVPDSSAEAAPGSIAAPVTPHRGAPPSSAIGRSPVDAEPTLPFP